MSGRHGYRNVERVRPDVEWADPPELAPNPEIDWDWVAEVLAARPGQWLRVAPPTPGRSWDATNARSVPHYVPFRPRGSHEAVVVGGHLYIRKFPVTNS